VRWMWIDRITEFEPRTRIVTIKCVSLAEEHLHDHFAADDPKVGDRVAMPLMPGSLMIEGMAQSAGILVGHAEQFRQKVVLAKINRAEINSEVVPGMTLRYTAVVDRLDAMGASIIGTVEAFDHATGEIAPSKIAEIDLMFSFIDQNMSGMDFPAHNFVFSDSFKTLLRMSGIEAEF
jgi:3-hydroxyacyl-[acyl-carrier-protein] dehydratase